jgi:SAM-dependent methyltransferase
MGTCPKISGDRKAIIGARMTLTNQFFPDKLIDDICENPDCNYFSSVLTEVFSLIPMPHEVCDVGCGNGLFTAALKKNTGCVLTGIDGSPYALQQASQLGFDALHKIDDFCSDRLPFSDETFDLVICKDVLEHLLSPDHLVQEISRILKCGARALIHVPNHFPISGRLKFLFSNNIDPFGYFPKSKRWEFPHIRFFNKNSLLQLLGLHSLQLERDLCHHFPKIPFFSRFLPINMKKWLVDNRSDAFSEGLTVLVRKAAIPCV